MWVLLQQCVGQGAMALDCMRTITPSLLWEQMKVVFKCVCVCVCESGGW